MTATCKKCGMKWADKEEIVDSTRAEHLKHVGHKLEVD